MEEKAYFWLSFMKILKFNKKFADVSICEKIHNFDDFSGFCSLEFDSFMRDLAIFRLRCNGQHFSIPKRQRLNNEIKLDLQTYEKFALLPSKKH